MSQGSISIIIVPRSPTGEHPRLAPVRAAQKGTEEYVMSTSVRNRPSGSSSPKCHWGRWAIASVVALIVLVVLAVGAFIEAQPSPAPLALSKVPASAPSGTLEGSWDVGTGSVAGFRLQETALFFITNDVVGRTNAVIGSFVVSGDRVTAATFRIDLTTMKVGGKVQAQFAKSLGTKDYPSATFTLTRPMTLSPAFASGATMTASATGQLTMHGASRPVSFTVSGRRSGAALQVAGSVRIVLANWGITEPAGLGPLGSLSDHGVAEFLLALDKK